MWEHFHHQADIGVRGIGESVEEAFAETAVALTAVICPPEKIDETRQIVINCNNNDRELLLADWLNAVIYEIATRNMLFSRFEVKIDGGNLAAKAWGEKIDIEKHRPVVEVKAATYSQLKVDCDQDGSWVAQCVVDV